MVLADKNRFRPITAPSSGLSTAWQTDTVPPYTTVTRSRELTSTSETQFTTPPTFAFPLRRVKPVGNPIPVDTVQPIWQTEAKDAPLPTASSASQFINHGRNVQRPAFVPPANPAPYSSALSEWISGMGDSTSHSTFYGGGIVPRRRPQCEPHKNLPIFTTDPRYGPGSKQYNTASSDAFPAEGRTGIARREAILPARTGQTPYTSTEANMSGLIRSTSKIQFVDFGAAKTSRRDPIRPKGNPPPY